ELAWRTAARFVSANTAAHSRRGGCPETAGGSIHPRDMLSAGRGATQPTAETLANTLLRRGLGPLARSNQRAPLAAVLPSDPTTICPRRTAGCENQRRGGRPHLQRCVRTRDQAVVGKIRGSVPPALRGPVR